MRILSSARYFLLVLFYCFFTGNSYTQDESENLFKKGEQYFFQKKYEIAEQTLLKVIEKNMAHPKAYSYLGDIHLFTNRYSSAIKYYNLAKEVSPNAAYEYFRLGQTYIELKNSDEAINSFISAYEQNPSLKISLYQTGYVYLYYKRDKMKAIEYWKKFITEAPDDRQYNQVKKAIALLEDKSCILPLEESGITMEEALMNCGNLVNPDFAKPKDTAAGAEKEKTNNDTEGLLNDSANGF